MNFTGLKITSSLAATAILALPRERVTEVNSIEVDSVVEVSQIDSYENKTETDSWKVKTSDERTSTVLVSVNAEPVWEESSQERFEELLQILAIDGELDVADQREFKALKSLRRQTHLSRTYNEIVEDHQMHEMVNAAIESLSNLIDYATRSLPPETHQNRS